VFAKFFPGLTTISVAMAGVTKMSLPSFLFLNGIGDATFCECARAARLDISKCDSVSFSWTVSASTNFAH
jgi:hypothetical protein